ncbi:hypothetical protein ACR52_26960 [Pseudomonas fildesensis]|uniref:Uncharacterized protein n=1 Tax=Pseudomonas fildesensis TaxID=1674920 RepID=A0A0J8FW18_9PSED|nr:hypothetical protein ACR52_26960 [Pseudomonas fildesensis]
MHTSLITPTRNTSSHLADAPELGIKTCFSSDSFSVYLCWALARVLMVSALITRAMTHIGQSTLILLICHGRSSTRRST